MKHPFVWGYFAWDQPNFNCLLEIIKKSPCDLEQPLMIYIVMIIQENLHKEKEDRAKKTKELVPPSCWGWQLTRLRLIKVFSSLNDSKIIDSTSKPNPGKSKMLKGHQLSWFWWIWHVAGFFLPIMWPDTKGRDRFTELSYPHILLETSAWTQSTGLSPCVSRSQPHFPSPPCGE